MERDFARILVVEDEADLAAGLARSLGRLEGVKVSVTHSAERALEELDRRTYALVISDVRLKGMDGLELLSRIRQAHAGTRVLMMTAYPSEHVWLQARRLGSDSVLEKPFDLEALHREVRRLLRAARREQAGASPEQRGVGAQASSWSRGRIGRSEV